METATTRLPDVRTGGDRLTGKDVYAAGGERLGSVAAVLPPAAGAGRCLLVKPGGLRGLLGGKPLYVPASAVSVVADNGVGLVYPKQAIKDQGWDERPAGLDRSFDA
jgi:hypothetical protein